MRILVLQLARFGDIYQTWPTLSALRRQHPHAELHVLVRERFSQAMSGCADVLVHALPTHAILSPIFEAENGGEVEAHARLNVFLQPLRDLQFNKIINLTYSPLSSFLSDDLAGVNSEITGYTRHADGHLHIPDDSSAYFYAQVGVGRGNRYHVTDIFAATAGVDLTDADFPITREPRSGIVVHLGASTPKKTYPPELWVKTLKQFCAQGTETITLVGSENERALSETVAAQVGDDRIVNLVGETQLHELFAQISVARLLIGADSAPIHMASLRGTPTLALSSRAVNFWETGPMAAGSRIMFATEMQNLDAEHIARQARSMLDGGAPIGPCVVRLVRGETYQVYGFQFDDFSWRLIEALYTSQPFPSAETHEDRLALQRLFELAELALHQLERWQDPKLQGTAAGILGQIDGLLAETGRIHPRVEPIIQWFETQRLRIPPGQPAETLARTIKTFQDLLWVAGVYRTFGDEGAELRKAIALANSCAPEFREYNFASLQGAFQSLLSTIHELARHSTKVAGEAWSTLLVELNDAIESRDYIQLADILQWQVVPSLEERLNAYEMLTPDPAP